VDQLRPTTEAGQAGLAGILADPATALAAFDYDGTLAPIVENPRQAVPLPGVVEALEALSRRLGHVAIVTGRPVATVIELMRLDAAAGLDSLVIMGQYGLERWDPVTRTVRSPAPPEGVELVRRQVPALLRTLGIHDASIEDKGLAVAVHVRRSADPEAAYARMHEPLRELADRAGLAAEPGRYVVELRPVGMDKGKALLDLAGEVAAGALMYTGDDLGDLAAYDAVDSWRAAGRPALLVCSGSTEVGALAERGDIVVDGPAGVLRLLDELLTGVRASR
jgi:trehalose 6-phosphate phosphatase